MAVTFSGKDKILKYTRGYVGGYDISGDAISFASLLNSLAQVDMTGWSNSIQQAEAGLRTAGVNDLKTIMNATAGRSLTALQTPGSAKNLIIAFGGGGEPAVGDPSYHLIGRHQSTVSDLTGGRGELTSKLFPEPSISWGNPLGRMQWDAATQITATINGSSVDWGADLPKTNGASAILMVLVTASGDYEFKIQHSTNDADWADYMTFSIDGSAVATDYQVAATTLNQYTRFQATRTAGSVYVVCSLAINNVFQVV